MTVYSAYGHMVRSIHYLLSSAFMLAYLAFDFIKTSMAWVSNRLPPIEFSPVAFKLIRRLSAEYLESWRTDGHSLDRRRNTPLLI